MLHCKKTLIRYSSLLFVLLILPVCLTVAATTIDSVIALAKKRYQIDTLDTVILWEKMLHNARVLSEPEQLTLTNLFFNSQIYFADDSAIWGSTDYWATPIETMTKQQGDCEDFTIAKYFSLRLLGVPSERLRLMYVKARIRTNQGFKDQAHMVLAYYPVGGVEPLIMDNLISTIEPASKRKDLTPIFGFNSEGLWIKNASTSLVKKPETRLSRWRELLLRLHQEGFQ